MRAGLPYLRFDYSGHGASEGAFTDGTIGGWLDDALDVLDRLTEGPAGAGRLVHGRLARAAGRARAARPRERASSASPPRPTSPKT